MEQAWSTELLVWVKARALAEGFDLVGIAEALPSQEDPLTAERFSTWIAEGRAGEMEYLKRRDASKELLRRSVRVPFPWARSVLVCAMNYNAAEPRSIDTAPEGAGWIARYAWSGNEADEPLDYHDDLLRRLRMVEKGLHERTECRTQCYVDTGPLLERDLAAKAGIGWVGKNTCVLNQELGSWLLLAVIVTSLPLAEEAIVQISPDRCGSCTRCIDACPTNALTAPREMDASLCIAYLTIEKKGSVAEELREKMGRQVFGCDICQDVCPWNRRAPVLVKPGLTVRKELVNPSLDWLAAMDDAEFHLWFKGSPLERTKRGRVQRNVAIAMGNSGRPQFRASLEQWAVGEDTVLAEAAVWALNRIASASLLADESAVSNGE